MYVCVCLCVCVCVCVVCVVYGCVCGFLYVSCTYTCMDILHTHTTHPFHSQTSTLPALKTFCINYKHLLFTIYYFLSYILYQVMCTHHVVLISPLQKGRSDSHTEVYTEILWTANGISSQVYQHLWNLRNLILKQQIIVSMTIFKQELLDWWRGTVEANYLKVGDL